MRTAPTARSGGAALATRSVRAPRCEGSRRPRAPLLSPWGLLLPLRPSRRALTRRSSPRLLFLRRQGSSDRRWRPPYSLLGWTGARPAGDTGTASTFGEGAIAHTHGVDDVVALSRARSMLIVLIATCEQALMS